MWDGMDLIGSRYKNLLHWIERQGVRDCDVCTTTHVDCQNNPDYRAVVVAHA